MAITVNLNDYMEVKLTKLGLEAHAKHYASLRMEYLEKDALKRAACFEQGWYRFQIHEVMHIFGPGLINGAETSFETTVRLVPSA